MTHRIQSWKHTPKICLPTGDKNVYKIKQIQGGKINR